MPPANWHCRSYTIIIHQYNHNNSSRPGNNRLPRTYHLARGNTYFPRFLCLARGNTHIPRTSVSPEVNTHSSSAHVSHPLCAAAVGFREPPNKPAWLRETPYTTISVFPTVTVTVTLQYPARAGIPSCTGSLNPHSGL